MKKLKSSGEWLVASGEKRQWRVASGEWLAVAVFLLITIHYPLSTAFASNVAVTNTSLTNVNLGASTVDVQFDLAQDNAFTGTDANSQSFYDRIWVFVKYWKDGWATDTAWKHATLTSGGTVGTYDSGTGVGITSDGKGAFCQTGTNQTLRWNFGTDGIIGTDTVKVRVMAIEMVYVPQGAFYVGDGSTGTTARFKQGNNDSAFNITSEAAITVGTSAGNLYYGATGGDYGDGAGPIPAAFPKGYNAFYIMKYEISQGQYRDFLNTLSRAQQNTRTETSLAAGTTSVTNRYVMSNTSTLSSRQGIRCDATIHTSNPITFYCDFDGDGVTNEATDGEWIACNYLKWADVTAYADWAGLRPFTELEFEKACRGGSPTSNVVAGEGAWGSATFTNANTIANSGAANEGVTETGNGLCNYGNDGVLGPLRCGFAAGAGTTRAQAGAGYYGIMELSGNLWERPVTVGHSTGRSFTGSHGNGALDATGNATNSDWPGTDGVGAGFRGGSWLSASTYSRVSDRYYAAYVNTDRCHNYGARCARTSP